MEKIIIEKIDKNGEVVKKFSSVVDAAKEAGVSVTTVSRQINGQKFKTHCGYTWRRTVVNNANVVDKKRPIVMLDENNNLLERLLSEKNYIYDRTTLIDDFVYSFLNKKESTLNQYKPIILSLLSQCQVFHLILDEEIRSKRFEQRGDKYITKEMIAHIAAYYGIFYSDLDNVHFLEITEDNDENIKKIMEVIENENITYCVK